MPDDQTPGQAETPEVNQETPAAEIKAGKKSKPDKKKPIAQAQPEEEPLVAEAVAEPSGTIEPPPAVSEPPSAASEPPAPPASVSADRNDDLFQQGVQAMLRGEYDEADNLFGQALLIYRKQGDQAGQIDVLEQLGHLCFLRGAQAQAREYYQQASSMRSG